VSVGTVHEVIWRRYARTLSTVAVHRVYRVRPSETAVAVTVAVS
jgi:hypothetical protein